MDSGITVTVKCDLKAESADSFFNEMLPELQKQTRAFKGVRSVRAVRQSDDPTKMMFIDIFDTVDDVHAYFKWRGERGDLDLLGTLVSQPPQIEIWPISQE